MTHSEALRGAQRGRREAIAFLYQEHRSMVYGVCLRIIRNREDAEDLVQDVFLRVMEQVPCFRGESDFKTWLYRIATNEATTLLRKRTQIRNGVVSKLDLVGLIAAAPVAAPANPIDLELDLEHALEQVGWSAKDWQIYRRKVAGYTDQEIADHLFCNPATVTRHLHFLRQQLRRLMHRESQ